MAKPVRLLTPLEKEVRTMERQLANLKEKTAAILIRSVGTGYMRDFSEAAALIGRAEASFRQIRSDIHERVKDR